MAPLVIFLHGFTHTGRSWDPVVRALGERYRALAPDLRGHGKAAERQPVTLEAVIDDLAALAPEEEGFALVGYSMGGRIALHAALALPRRPERLVLIGASPGIADATERAARQREDERLADRMARTPSIEEVAQRWASTTSVVAGQPASVREAVHRDRIRNTPTGLARALRGLGTGALPSLWDRLATLSMPVALVVGERDTKFRAIAEQMEAATAHAHLLIVLGAGHAVHLEAPGVVADMIAVEASA